MPPSPATSSNAIPIPTRRKGENGKQSSGVSASPSSGPSSFGSATSSSPSTPEVRRRRESLMSPSFSEASHTVINVGGDEHPRLISCVKASQGFWWNQEIFLPSYTHHNFDAGELERRQDPVAEIWVSDEEVERMFPE
ncbi:hypothetical protein DE146DRAFT_733136 [Phaeosphaeria sp. MPI-PUGE-AT-0046c]|nr:hypothetical protein DE146DRAFT_733136 [Phaeosphaeria sp. MPI-PUGE-AT-0046c]